MKTVIVYIIIMVILGIRSYLQNKAKQQVASTQEATPENEDEYADENEEEDRYEQTQEKTIKSPEELFMEMIERAKEESKQNKESLTTEAAKANMFQEGSSRKQHSSQYESAPHKPVTQHNIHPDYNRQPDEDGEGLEMTPEKMRQALIYQTIIERPEY
ncbi:MAG: hypothetical protein MJZ13_01610 [Bacteroidales bacterium]|nr:hypothetical protein [Bacteroidales bacterium]